MPENPNLLTMLIPYILIFAVFYFILILPQRKRDKKMKEMLAALQVGDQVITIGGMYGKVTTIKDDILTIEVGADKTKLKIARWAVKSVETIKA
ncbi:MAG: preprotein translocase subunit YajC [Firmicutes bacterium]|nr:preprotein translocase subunit YajC [Bacillota bacterium]